MPVPARKSPPRFASRLRRLRAAFARPDVPESTPSLPGEGSEIAGGDLPSDPTPSVAAEADTDEVGLALADEKRFCGCEGLALALALTLAVPCVCSADEGTERDAETALVVEFELSECGVEPETDLPSDLLCFAAVCCPWPVRFFVAETNGLFGEA